MASEAIERSPQENEFSSTNIPEKGELHQDVEVGPDMINVDRIEKVYA